MKEYLMVTEADVKKSFVCYHLIDPIKLQPTQNILLLFMKQIYFYFLFSQNGLAITFFLFFSATPISSK